MGVNKTGELLSLVKYSSKRRILVGDILYLDMLKGIMNNLSHSAMAP